MSYIIKQNDGILILLHVQPGASKSEIVGIHGNRIKVRLNAPPIDGKANKELLKFLSKTLELPKNQIEIVGGLASRQKKVKLAGAPEEIKKTLESIISAIS